MKKALLTLLLALPLLFSCSETFSPSIRIQPSLTYVPYTGGSVDITVMTDLPWVVTAEEGTATLSKASGAGDDVVTVTVPATDNWTTSCVSVVFTSRSNSATATRTAIITQGYKPYISVAGHTGTVAAEGGKVQVIVTANDTWRATCSTEGVTVTPAGESTGNYTVVITVPANTTGEKRKITVDFAIDGDSDSFEFYQAN